MNCQQNVLKIILLMKERNKKQGVWISVFCYDSIHPGDFCVGLGVQASEETARKLKFNKLLLCLCWIFLGLSVLSKGSVQFTVV